MIRKTYVNNGRRVKLFSQVGNKPVRTISTRTTDLNTDYQINNDGSVIIGMQKWPKAEVLNGNRVTSNMSGNFSTIRENMLNPAQVNKIRNKPVMKIDMNNGYFTPIEAVKPQHDKYRKIALSRNRIFENKDDHSITSTILGPEIGMRQIELDNVTTIGRRTYNPQTGERLDGKRPLFHPDKFHEKDIETGANVYRIPFVRSGKIPKEIINRMAIATENFKVTPSVMFKQNTNVKKFKNSDERDLNPVMHRRMMEFSKRYNSLQPDVRSVNDKSDNKSNKIIRKIDVKTSNVDGNMKFNSRQIIGIKNNDLAKRLLNSNISNGPRTDNIIKMKNRRNVGSDSNFSSVLGKTNSLTRDLSKNIKMKNRNDAGKYFSSVQGNILTTNFGNRDKIQARTLTMNHSTPNYPESVMNSSFSNGTNGGFNPPASKRFKMVSNSRGFGKEKLSLAVLPRNGKTLITNLKSQSLKAPGRKPVVY